MVTPIDSSQYLGLIGSIDTFPTRESLYTSVAPAYTETSDYQAPPDFSGYYSNPEIADLYSHVSENVKNSYKALDNAMVNALENGFGVREAVNMNLALRAYQANCTVANSTFELKI